MTSKFLRVFLAVAVLFTISALAQTGSSSTPATTAPSAPTPAATTPAAQPALSPLLGTKVGAINVEAAIFATNEGQRDITALGKKFEPKQAELKSANDELDGLKKQLNTQGDKLSPEAADTLKKQIETKQKLFDRNMQDAQEEFGSQQQEIAGRILNKMAPLIFKYAQENGYGMILDTSKQWPQSPVLISGEGMDITKAIVDNFNAQSGVPAPAAGTAKPPAKPATPVTKPATGTGTPK